MRLARYDVLVFGQPGIEHVVLFDDNCNPLGGGLRMIAPDLAIRAFHEPQARCRSTAATSSPQSGRARARLLCAARAACSIATSKVAGVIASRRASTLSLGVCMTMFHMRSRSSTRHAGHPPVITHRDPITRSRWSCVSSSRRPQAVTTVVRRTTYHSTPKRGARAWPGLFRSGGRGAPTPGGVSTTLTVQISREDRAKQ